MTRGTSSKTTRESLQSEWLKLSALKDAELLDEEQRLRLQLLTDHPDLAEMVKVERRILKSLRDGVLSAEPSATQENFVDAVLARAGLMPPRLRVVNAARSKTSPVFASRSRSPWPWWVAGAGAAALVYGVARTPDKPPDIAAPAALLPAAPSAIRMTYSSGDVDSILRPAAGASLVTESGHVCVEPAPGVDICLGENSHVQFESMGEHEQVLRLLKGDLAVALDDRPRNMKLSVVAGATWATAAGTVFAVSARPNETRVTALQGLVKVGKRNRGVAVSPQESALVVGSAGPTVVRSSAVEQVAAWRLLEPAALWRRGVLPAAQSHALLSISADDRVAIQVDGVELGDTPLSVQLNPGRHQVAFVKAQGETPEVREVELASGEHSAMRFKSPELASTAAVRQPQKSAPRATAEAGSSPKELLSRARSHAAAGDWRRAAASYRELRRQFPNSPEAATVLVSLGDIERLRLGNPSAALNAYRAYLKSGGALAPEARSGIARALRAAGRRADERKAIEDYLKAYPNGVEATTFRKRLSELQ